jgi:hypothetical protein
MWGKDLYGYLREIYFERALYTVMFISKNYATKLWTNHERQSAQARAFREHEEYVLPVRFDDTEIPGLLPTTGYIDLRTTSPDELAELIKQKVGHVPRPNFFPDHPNALFEMTETKTTEDCEAITAAAEHIQEALGLMTLAERKLLQTAALNACPAGLPENIHLNLEYLSRRSGHSTADILAMISRLDCLGVKSRVYEGDEASPEGSLITSRQFLELRFEVYTEKFGGNATRILEALFQVIGDRLCGDCTERALSILDFSCLSDLTGFQDKDAVEPSGT